MPSIPKRPQIFYQFVSYPVHNGTECQDKDRTPGIGKILDYSDMMSFVKNYNYWHSGLEQDKEYTKQELMVCFKPVSAIVPVIGNLVFRGKARTKAACKYLLDAPNKEVYNLDVSSDGRCLDLLYFSSDVYTDDKGNVFFVGPSDYATGDMFLWDTRKSGFLHVRGVDRIEYETFERKQKQIMKVLGI